MGTTLTTNYSLIKPNPFEEEDTWGSLLNTNWDSVDSILFGKQSKTTATSALAAVTPAADTLPYFTSASAAATTTITAFGRTILTSASAAALNTTLGLGASNSPTFAGMSLTGNLVLDSTTPYLPQIRETHASATAGSSSSLIQQRSRGSLVSPVIVQNGDVLGLYAVTGHDGTSFINAAWITATVDGTPATNSMPGRLSFSTTPSGGATPIERLRIDSAGDVLILGNSLSIGNIDTTLNRVSAGVVAIEGKNIALNGTGETLTTGSIELGAASDTTITRSAAGVIAVEGGVIPKENRANTFGADQVINGNVGIGTTPSYPLDVRSATAQINLQSSTGTNFVRHLMQNTGGVFQFSIDSSTAIMFGNGAYSRNIYSDGAYPLIIYTNGVERMRVTSAGDVGIGGSPNTKLDVRGPSGVTSFTGTSKLGFMLRASASTTDYTGIDFSEFNGGFPFARIGMLVGASGSSLSFGTSNNYGLGVTNTAMTIGPGGNLGIGTTAPGDKLHVEGNIYLGSTSRTIYTGGAATLYIQTNTGEIKFSRSNGSVECLRIDTNNNVLVPGPGALGYGTGSGGTVTQVTNKATGVTMNKTNGQIITTAAALGADSEVSFIVTNSTVAATDNIILTKASGGVATKYQLYVGTVSAGSFEIAIRNVSGASGSDAITINFAVIKSATA